jgi:hypothetical protein
MTLFERVHKPAFAGATGWHSEPLGPAELRGPLRAPDAKRLEGPGYRGATHQGRGRYLARGRSAVTAGDG